jgi:WD40 repeat protein
MQRSNAETHARQLDAAFVIQTGSTGFRVFRIPLPRWGLLGWVLFGLLTVACYQSFQESAEQVDTRQVAVMRGPAESIRALALSPDGTLLAALGWNQSVALWDVGSQRMMVDLVSDQHPVYCVAFSPDGLTLATGNKDGTLTFWDTDTWQKRRELAMNPSGTCCLAFSIGRKILASGYFDGEIALLDQGCGQVRTRFLGHKGVTCLALSPDGWLLASGGSNGAVRLWETESGHLVRELSSQRDAVSAVAFSADGKSLASARWACGEVKVWDVATWRERLSLNTPDLVASSLVFSSDNQTLAAGSGLNISGGAGSGVIVLWDLTIGCERARLKGHANWVSCLGLSADGSLLASGGMDGSIRLWDIAPKGSGL